MTRFDPSPWNLGAPLVGAVAACGPVIPLEQDGRTSLSDTDPEATTGESSGTTGMPECQSTPDCPPYTYCDVFGHCRPDQSCGEFGCCYAEGCCYDDPCCYGGGGPECATCYSHLHCDLGQFCEYSYCRELTQPFECVDALSVEIVLDTLPTTSIVLALAFVETDGDVGEELVIGHGSGAWLVPGPDEEPIDLPVPDLVPVTSIAGGDFDGDGDDDIAIATGSLENDMSVLRNDGDGVFTNVTPASAPGAYELRAGDLNGDGLADLVGTMVFGATPVLAALPNDGDMQFDIGTLVLLDAINAQVDFEVADVDGTGFADVVAFNLVGVTQAWFGSDPINGSPGFASSDSMGITTARIVFGDFQGDGITDLARLSTWSGFTLVDNWYGSGGALYENVEWGLPIDTQQATAGDLNGDGRDDLVIINGAALRVLFGDGAQWFGCTSAFTADISSYLVAMGDFTGDGAAEVAITDQQSIRVLTIQPALVPPPG